MVEQFLAVINSSQFHLVRTLGERELIVGTSIGLLDWSIPGKFGGKCGDRIDGGGAIADLTWSGVEEGVLGVSTASGVRTCVEED